MKSVLLPVVATLLLAAPCTETLAKAKAKTSAPKQEQQAAVKQPKYVFYFITDGTGVNTVHGTEYYLMQKTGKLGIKQLCCTSFPVVGVAATWSATSDVTDSAASGTALATGTKTYNSAIGVATDSVTPLFSLAQRAHDKGLPVGVGTSVPVNHATPAAQFAHQRTRHEYYEIACQMAATQFDFFGGGSINLQSAYNKPEVRDSLYNALRKVGYTITTTLDDYKQNGVNADKLVMLQGEVPDSYSLPYWIDRKPGQVTIVDQVRAELDLLYRKSQAKGNCGFFLMNEAGGKVDMACHAQDGATAFEEMIACDSCIRVAYDFYLQHPDETLIVVTADHETGGLTLGRNSGGYHLNVQILQHQKASIDEANRHMMALATSKGGLQNVTFDELKDLLKADFGFWDGVKLNDKDVARLQREFEKTKTGESADVKNLYSSSKAVMNEALNIMKEKSCLGWTTGGHTSGLVPVYACGVGAEQFMGENDNAEIARKIAAIAGY